MVQVARDCVPHTPVPALPVVNVRLAVAVLPVFSELRNRLLEVFVYVPEVGEVGTLTNTLIRQVPLGASVPFEKVSVVSLAAGAKVGEPQLDVEYVAGLATFMPEGSGSVKLIPVMVVEVGLLIVKVRVDVPPAMVEAGEKAFENETVVGSMMEA